MEVLQVQLSGENQAGIDWSFVRRVAGLGNLSAESAPTLTSNTGTVSLVKPSASGSDNLFFIRALERFGRVSSAYSSVVTTMNRQPVPLGSLSTQSYLKQVSPTVVTTASGGTVYGAPSLTPGEVTTGFSMSLLPVVLDSNEIMLQSTINISSLREMATFTSGSGLAQQTIQTPNTASFSTQQRMSVRSGDTIVLSGLESEAAETKENDVVRQAVPVSRRNTREKSTVVILITPRLLEN